MSCDYPGVTIVIVHWGPPDDTLVCLDSLAAISYPRWRALVVDNGPDAGALADRLGSRSGVTVLATKTNLGFGAGANVGIAQALADGAEYVLLLNNDTYVARDFLEPLVTWCQEHSLVGIVGPKVYYYESHRLYSAGAWPRRWLPLLLRQLHPVDLDESAGEVVVTPQPAGYIWGQAMLIRSVVLRRVGLFDTSFFMYYEDCDLCWRAREAGYEIYFVPQSHIWHRVAEGTRGGEWQRWRYCIASMHYFYRKHGWLGDPGALTATALTLAGIMLAEARKGNLRWLSYPVVALSERLRTG